MTVTHGPPIFPRSVDGRIPDEQADERLRALRALVTRRAAADLVEALRRSLERKS